MVLLTLEVDGSPFSCGSTVLEVLRACCGGVAGPQDDCKSRCQYLDLLVGVCCGYGLPGSECFSDPVSVPTRIQYKNFF